MLTRLLLRFSALGLKFALAIVVARTLGFDAIAAYGLAVAASVIASKVLGLGFSPELNRRLSETNPMPAIAHARRLCVVYGALYVLLAAALAVATLNEPAAASTHAWWSHACAGSTRSRAAYTASVFRGARLIRGACCRSGCGGCPSTWPACSSRRCSMRNASSRAAR
ncbi:hypothetical protein [Burkholderia cepacia]|uniref:hypothetical protein n=1 Tax=Burkholderia cepacia TaxID=292 RepID=UPI003D66A5BA